MESGESANCNTADSLPVAKSNTRTRHSPSIPNLVPWARDLVAIMLLINLQSVLLAAYLVPSRPAKVYSRSSCVVYGI